MISDTLRRLSDEGTLTAKALADLLDLDPSSAYRYLSGETEPRFGQIRTLFRQSRSPEVQRQVLAALCSGTGWVMQHLPAKADVNGDGQVNTDDIFDGAVHSLGGVQSLLKHTRDAQKTGMRRIAPARAEAMKLQIRNAIGDLLATEQAVEILTDQPARSAARL